MPTELAFVQLERRDGRVIVRLTGEIDLSNADDLHQRIAHAAEGSSLAVIDLGELDYIDSQGLRVLKQIATELAASGAELEVVAPPGTIARDVIDITRLGDAIPIRDALEP